MAGHPVLRQGNGCLFQQETRIWETDDDLEFTTYDTVVLVVDGAIL